jgi:hypothetical protein
MSPKKPEAATAEGEEWRPDMAGPSADEQAEYAKFLAEEADRAAAEEVSRIPAIGMSAVSVIPLLTWFPAPTQVTKLASHIYMLDLQQLH